MKTAWTSGSGTRCMRRTSCASASPSRFRRSWSSRSRARWSAIRGAARATTTCSRRTPSATSATLMENVTLHPAMGVYLSMLGNQKPDAARNIRPDENYARELMQLFTIGLVELNSDGSVQDRRRRQAASRPTTRRSCRASRTSTPAGLTRERRASRQRSRRSPTRSRPMQAYPEQHATGTKRLLSYPGAVASVHPGRPVAAAGPRRRTRQHLQSPERRAVHRDSG